MEFAGIVEFLKNKSILVTGSTGYLAKRNWIFVEKLLRIQPQVRRVFLLIRASDAKSAAQRVEKQVIEEQVFRILGEKHGKDFPSFISNKVTAVAGDIFYQNLGITDSCTVQEIWSEVSIVVNVAATTNFLERYDVALGVNALGAKHVLEFAKKCSKLEMLLHVSTAYAAKDKSGLIMEKEFHMGEATNGNSTLDIDVEMKLVNEKLKELNDLKATEGAITRAMKEMGTLRSRHFGWSNVYVFTKALGEMLLGQYRDNIPLVILRPTIVTSTYSEPFPGWIQGMRTLDSVILGYAKGKVKFYLSNPLLPLDVIPGDMVVNAMIAAMVVHSNQQSQFIYHVSSSVRNPLKTSLIQSCAYRYFSTNPWIGNDGTPIKVGRIRLFETKESFYRYMTMTCKLPLKALGLVNAIFCKLFQEVHTDLTRKFNYVMRLAQIYEPFIFFQGRFDDKNLGRLRSAIRDGREEFQMLGFDPRCIDWEDYMMNIHIPGLLKHASKPPRAFPHPHTSHHQPTPRPGFTW
ncbi:hypothetical protein ACLOJK_020705 [Asimina triloba]